MVDGVLCLQVEAAAKSLRDPSAVTTCGLRSSSSTSLYSCMYFIGLLHEAHSVRKEECYIILLVACEYSDSLKLWWMEKRKSLSMKIKMKMGLWKPIVWCIVDLITSRLEGYVEKCVSISSDVPWHWWSTWIFISGSLPSVCWPGQELRTQTLTVNRMQHDVLCLFHLIPDPEYHKHWTSPIVVMFSIIDYHVQYSSLYLYIPITSIIQLVVTYKQKHIHINSKT